MADQSFGKWLKHQRRIRGWTQKELALQLNCSISAVRKMESEERRPSTQAVARLSELLDVPQNEHRSFLRFARGDWQSNMAEEGNDAFPRISQFAPRPNLPRSTMSFMGVQDADGLLGVNGKLGDVGEKLVLIHQALELAESAGDIRRQIESLWQLGWLEKSNRFSYWEKALSLARILGDAYGLASGLSTAGFFLVLNGDLDAASTYLAESSALYHQLQLRPIASHLLSAYGQISLIRGDYQKARSLLQEHARASLELGNREDYLWSRVRLGYVALREENLEEARSIFVASAQEFKKDKNFIGVVFTLEGFATLALRTDIASRATRLIGWADSTREKISDERPLLEQADVDEILATCREKLGIAEFSDAYQEGQRMTMGEAVAYALSES